MNCWGEADRTLVGIKNPVNSARNTADAMNSALFLEAAVLSVFVAVFFSVAALPAFFSRMTTMTIFFPSEKMLFKVQ